MKTISQLQQEIVDRSLQAFRAGLFTGTSGNMSCYLREEGKMLITPTSVRYEELQPKQVVVMQLDGTVLSGPIQPSSEWRMHAAIYEAMPEVNATVSTAPSRLETVSSSCSLVGLVRRV